MSAAIDRKLAQARERLQNADATGARAVCQEILKRAPRNPQALVMLGISYLAENLPAEAVAPLERAIAVEPRNGMALEHIGLAHLMSGDFPAAERALETAVTIPGAPASVFMRLGIALLRQDRHEAAHRMLEKARTMAPRDPHVLLNLGEAADKSGDFTGAEQHFEQVLRLAPESVDAMFNLGVVALKQSDFARAKRWFDAALRRAPASADISQSLAIALIGLGHYRDAIVLLRQVLTAEESRADAHAALAEALFETGDMNGAKEHAQRAIELDKLATKPYATLADVNSVAGQFNETVTALESGFSRTGSIELLGKLVFQARRLCDWARWNDAWPKLAAALPASAEPVSPFSLLCEPLSADEQLACARRWSAQYRAAESPSPRSRTSDERIRVGYFSSDFYEHATAYLLAEVLELHDRNSFEIFAYSYGPDDHSPMRKRLETACEHFIDLAHQPDDPAAARIANDGLHLLVDLKGYTLGARPGVLARRPCARQLSWLGYPGSMGAPFIDYLIADSITVPAGCESHYSERVLRLPQCYQPNDRQRAVEAPLARSGYDLTDDGFVFCALTQTYKITPDVFACWMRLLDKTPGSVLWLLSDNPWATENLRDAASRQGIDASRLIFAPKMPLAKHLARYRVADLALDTLPYGSHTTASDALWAGCPIVALCGDTFAARVCASILNAAGFPELSVNTLEEYEALAFRLTRDDAFKDSVRARLAQTKLETPLFDSEQFTRGLEQLYRDVVS